MFGEPPQAVHGTLQLQAERLGAGHPLRAQSLLRLSALEYKKHAPERAIDLAPNALEIQCKTLSPGDFEVSRTEQYLGHIRRASQ